MYYWNRANFVGLLDLATALREDSHLEGLARYCELRERGLRQQALAELDQFLQAAQLLDTGTRREVAAKIASLHIEHPETHQFLAHPLRTHFVEPELAAWSTACPDAAEPLSLLAVLRHDSDLLRRALALDPQNVQVRTALVTVLVRHVDFATHHLGESRFIGSEADALSALEEARDLLAGMPEAAVGPLRREVTSLTELVHDWLSYRAAPEGTFRDWSDDHCTSRGWWSVAYYRTTGRR
jgi:hypothetical protein